MCQHGTGRHTLEPRRDKKLVFALVVAPNQPGRTYFLGSVSRDYLAQFIMKAWGHYAQSQTHEGELACKGFVLFWANGSQPWAFVEPWEVAVSTNLYRINPAISNGLFYPSVSIYILYIQIWYYRLCNRISIYSVNSKWYCYLDSKMERQSQIYK